MCVLPQYIRDMFNEHNVMSCAKLVFTAWNAGHIIDTTPEREVLCWCFCALFLRLCSACAVVAELIWGK